MRPYCGHRVTVEPSAAGAEAQDIVRYDNATGARSALVSAEPHPGTGLQAPRDRRLRLVGHGARLLVFTNTKKVWRRNTRGDYWALDVKDGKLGKTKTLSGGKLPVLELDFLTPLLQELFTRREQAFANSPQPAKPVSALFERQLAEGPRVESELRSGGIPPCQSFLARLLRRFPSLLGNEDDQLDRTRGDRCRELDYSPAILGNGHVDSVRLHRPLSTAKSTRGTGPRLCPR